MSDVEVLVVDDQALFRRSLVTILRMDSDTFRVAEASNGQEAVDACAAHHFDVVLMDIQMPVLDGIEATRRILQERPQTRVVVLTAFEYDEYVYAALRVGASGFLLKDTTPEALRAAIHTAHQGQALLSPAALTRLLQRYTPSHPPMPAPGLLTQRQTEILTLVAQGLSNQEIAEYLTISSGTLKSHISALRTRLDARDRAQLVIAAYRMGLGRGDR